MSTIATKKKKSKKPAKKTATIEAKCDLAVVTPFIDVSKVVDVEMDVHGYLHGARRELDTLLFLTDNALGLETLWDVSTPEARRAVADSARQAFVDALRQIQVAEDTLESFRKDLQKGEDDAKKNGGR